MNERPQDTIALRRWESLKIKVDALISRVENLSSDNQHFRPSSKEFNALEMLGHMAIIEEMYVAMLKKQDQIQLSSLPSKPRFFFYRALDRMRQAKNVPTLKSMCTPGTPAFEEVKARWIIARDEIESIYLNTPAQGTFLKHPIFGRLSHIDVVDLLEAHLQYHNGRFPVRIK